MTVFGSSDRILEVRKLANLATLIQESDIVRSNLVLNQDLTDGRLSRKRKTVWDCERLGCCGGAIRCLNVVREAMGSVGRR